jgi:thermospermine synthase
VENKYLVGKTFSSASTLSKAVRNSYQNYFFVERTIDRLDNETHVYIEGTTKFIYGHGHGNAHRNTQG